MLTSLYSEGSIGYYAYIIFHQFIEECTGAAFYAMWISCMQTDPLSQSVNFFKQIEQ